MVPIKNFIQNIGNKVLFIKGTPSEDATCFRCRNEVENIIHMLVLCMKEKEFWNVVLEYIKTKVTTTYIILCNL